jgi:hypothetical protein
MNSDDKDTIEEMAAFIRAGGDPVRKAQAIPAAMDFIRAGGIPQEWMRAYQKAVETMKRRAAFWNAIEQVIGPIDPDPANPKQLKDLMTEEQFRKAMKIAGCENLEMGDPIDDHLQTWQKPVVDAFRVEMIAAI